MIRRFTLASHILLLSLLATHCGKRSSVPASNPPSREPVSVRGWIADIEQPSDGRFRTIETEAARRKEIYQQTTVWIDNAPYVSGGVSEAGAFILLDVPPGSVTITFRAPNSPEATLRLEGIPGNADVFIPALLIKGNETRLLQPERARVRIASDGPKARATGRTARASGSPIQIFETPVAELANRRDYPEPGGLVAPIATFK